MIEVFIIFFISLLVNLSSQISGKIKFPFPPKELNDIYLSYPDIWKLYFVPVVSVKNKIYFIIEKYFNWPSTITNINFVIFHLDSENRYKSNLS